METPFAKQEEETLPKASKIHMATFILLQCILIGLTITDLALYRWFDYCYWEFGLLRVDDCDPDNTFGYDWRWDIDDHVCSDNSNQDYVENQCEDFCDNLTDIKHATDAMLACGSLCVGLQAATVIIYFLNLSKGWFQSNLVFVLLGIQTLLFPAGLSFFFGLGKFNDYERVSLDPEMIDVRNFTWEVGIILAICICILLPIFNLYGFLATRKVLTRDG